MFRFENTRAHTFVYLQIECVWYSPIKKAPDIYDASLMSNNRCCWCSITFLLFLLITYLKWLMMVFTDRKKWYWTLCPLKNNYRWILQVKVSFIIIVTYYSNLLKSWLDKCFISIWFCTIIIVPIIYSYFIM